MSETKHPHVAGFALGGDDAQPVVCVRIEAGDGLGVWIGRRWPGQDTEVITDAGGLKPISVAEACEILETWPETRGKVADAIQSAAWHGRRQLIPARLHAMIEGSGAD